MTKVSNCIVCADEFNDEDMQSLALSEINFTKFKICQSCFDKSDPSEDYLQAREIVNTYLKFAEAKTLLKEAKSILNSRKK